MSTEDKILDAVIKGLTETFTEAVTAQSNYRDPNEATGDDPGSSYTRGDAGTPANFAVQNRAAIAELGKALVDALREKRESAPMKPPTKLP
jgi:hypothetical protein